MEDTKPVNTTRDTQEEKKLLSDFTHDLRESAFEYYTNPKYFKQDLNRLQISNGLKNGYEDL